MSEQLDTALDTALYSADPVERDGARRRVAETIDDGGLAGLIAALDAPQQRTRQRAARILSEMRPRRVGPALEAALLERRNSRRQRVEAARLLAFVSPEDAPALATGLADPEAAVRRASASTAAPEGALQQALADPDPGVAGRAAAALLLRGVAPDARAARDALVRHGDAAPRVFFEALAAADPRAPELAIAAQSNVEAALDHLRDPGVWLSMLDGPHRIRAAWGVVGPDLEALVGDADPRIRMAVARGLPHDHAMLKPLIADDDPAVAWMAKRAAAGAFSDRALARRLEPHDRNRAASAHPPYGLTAADADAARLAVDRIEAGLALCQTRMDLNVGVAIRSAEAAGLSSVWLVGNGAVSRSASRGTDAVIPVRTVPDPAAMIRRARTEGLQIVAIQQAPGSVPYHRAAYPPRPLFVVGAEGTGVPAPLRHAADLLVEIPQWGAIDSLNVAAAATVVMFHWRAHLDPTPRPFASPRGGMVDGSSDSTERAP